MFEGETSGKAKMPSPESNEENECKIAQEETSAPSSKKERVYSICCGQGKVDIKALKPPPVPIRNIMLPSSEHKVCRLSNE